MVVRKFRDWVKHVIQILGNWGTTLKGSRLAHLRAGRFLIDVFLWPSDYMRIRRKYAGVFGRPPRLLRAKTFNEKLQRSKLFRRKAIYTQWADKIAVRKYVSERIGPEHLAEHYWTGTDLREARRVELPSRFVIKPNHLFGAILFVPEAERFDWASAHEKTQALLRKDHSCFAAEWEYRWIKPQLLIEEFLISTDGNIPIDYKFFCFGGRTELIAVHYDRYTRHSKLHFDRDFNPLAVTNGRARYDGPPASRPTCFEEMLLLAEILAGDESFMRVDFYDMGRPIFGELTLHPGAGTLPFDPPSWDEKLGSLMK